jgi:hypothetical protein
MKQFLLFPICSFITVFNCFSQQRNDSYKWPGYVRLNDSVIMMQTEVSIFKYADYLHEVKLSGGSYNNLGKAIPSPNQVDWILYYPFTKTNFMLGELFELIDSTSADWKWRKRPNSNEVVISTNIIHQLFQL